MAAPPRDRRDPPRPCRARFGWLLALVACCVWLGALRGSTTLIHSHHESAMHLHVLPSPVQQQCPEEADARQDGALAHDCGQEHDDGLHLRVAVPMFELARGVLVPRVPPAGMASEARRVECLAWHHLPAARATRRVDPPPRPSCGGTVGVLLSSRALLV